jgi:hypothetical protein
LQAGRCAFSDSGSAVLAPVLTCEDSSGNKNDFCQFRRACKYDVEKRGRFALSGVQGD